MNRRWVILVAVALLAGCTGTPDERPPAQTDGPGTISPGPGVAPQQGTQEDTELGMGMITILEPCDEGHCINATVTNEGSDTYYVSSICTSPWRESMEREGKDVQHREPTFTCLAFGTQPMAPGETRSTEWSWNETLWSDDNQAYEPAPQGAYQWSIAFEFWTGPDGGQAHEVETTHTVVVGET